MYRNRPRKNGIIIKGLTLDITSSLNKFFLCDCGSKFWKKTTLEKHVGKCTGKVVLHQCHWCKLEFRNRGNLVLHARLLHGDTSYQNQSNVKAKKYRCNACEDSSYDAYWKLKYHIRKCHFNLWAGTTQFESKKVNQVWCESVLNTTNIVEMTKMGPNTILMKRLAPDTAVQVTDQPCKVGLHSVYPCGQRKVVEIICKICKKKVKRRDLKKHIQEAHQEGFIKHKCNNCNMSFKRSYIFLKHVCNFAKRDRVAGVTFNRQRGIMIANVASLQPVEIDD